MGEDFVFKSQHPYYSLGLTLESICFWWTRSQGFGKLRLRRPGIKEEDRESGLFEKVVLLELEEPGQAAQEPSGEMQRQVHRRL